MKGPIFMEMQRTEGIILSTLDYQDYDQILTVFSKELGLVKFFFKGARRKKALTDPLTRVEFVYSRGKSDLLIVCEISIIDTYLQIRKDLSYLEAGCALIRAVQSSQFPEKPAPDLYLLLTRYLQHLPKISPEILVISFKLKLLRHDGLYGLLPQCSTCKAPLNAFHLNGTESVCALHAEPGAPLFSSEEADQIYLLAFCRNLNDLACLDLTPEFSQKIEAIGTY